jgi:hypothetical protein
MDFLSFGCFYDVRSVFRCFSMAQTGRGKSVQHLNDESKAMVCVDGEVRSGEADQRDFRDSLLALSKRKSVAIVQVQFRTADVKASTNYDHSVSVLTPLWLDWVRSAASASCKLGRCVPSTS